jgi:retron-type reverse transcriptase
VVVDIDLSKYFDTINHDLLNGIRPPRGKRARSVGTHQEISEKWRHGERSQGGDRERLASGWSSIAASVEHLPEQVRQGDGETGHRHVRYADDTANCAKSKRAGERVLASCRSYLEKKLKLKMNEEKSGTESPLKAKFLGFALYKVREGRAA